MFNQKKYYQYIKQMENIAIFKYIIVVAICILLGLLLGITNPFHFHFFNKTGDIKGLISGAIIGILVYYIIYLKDMIKIEEMKMKLDIYNKIKAE